MRSVADLVVIHVAAVMDPPHLAHDVHSGVVRVQTDIEAAVPAVAPVLGGGGGGGERIGGDGTGGAEGDGELCGTW